MMFAGVAQGGIILDEDFEGLSLGPFVSTSESGGDGTDWTDVPPAGWTRDNTTTPEGGPPEFFGFTFLDINSYNATAGQGRGDFTLASGTVMLADGDEYDDDAGNGGVLGGDSEAMNVFIETAPAAFTSAPGTMNLKWDNDFRAYENQTATVEVSFNGGATFSNVYTQVGTDDRDVAKLISLNNPASGDLVVQFGYTNADNDWWWAIDNILVFDALEGDVNQDGSVDLLDFEVIRDHMFLTGVAITDGDLNLDGAVNFVDFRIWKSAAFPAAAAAVPEPATCVLIAIGFTAVLSFRRRQDN